MDAKYVARVHARLYRRIGVTARLVRRERDIVGCIGAIDSTGRKGISFDSTGIERWSLRVTSGCK